MCEGMYMYWVLCNNNDTPVWRSHIAITTHRRRTTVGECQGCIASLSGSSPGFTFIPSSQGLFSLSTTYTYIRQPSRAHEQFSLVMVLKLTGTMIILSLIQPQTWSRDQSRLRLLTWARLSFRFHELEMIFDHVACSLVSSL